MGDARTIFRLPFSPLSSTVAGTVDAETVDARIRALGLSADRESLLRAFWALDFNGDLQHAGYTQALRRVALTHGEWTLTFEACASYKIAGGTWALVSALAADSSADTYLGADVRRLATDDAGVRAKLADGRVFEARNAVVTVPLHAQHRIALEPDARVGRRGALERGQVGFGTTIWFTIPETRPFVALGSADWPLTLFQSEYTQNGKTYVIAFIDGAIETGLSTARSIICSSAASAVRS